MGKYRISGGVSTADMYIKYAIANELAEANRLKRIELKINEEDKA